MRRRLLLSYVSLTAVVLAVLVVPLGVVNARTERGDLAAKVERDAQAVASIAEDTLETGSDRSVPAIARLARSYLERTGGRILVVDRRGRSVVDPLSAAGRDFSTRPEIATALTGTVATGARRSDTLGTDLLYVAVPVASGGVVHGAARITYPLSTVDERVRRYWLLLAGVAAVVLGLVALLGVRLARWASGPITGIETAAEAVGMGDLHARAPTAGPPEVRRLARTFNDTVAKLEGLLASQEAFVADASHQLRTPLTALRLRLENLERDVAEPGREDLEAALDEVTRLSALVDALLALARADAGVSPAAPFDLAALVHERVLAWEALAAERGVVVEAETARVPRAYAAAERVEQVLDNLLDNALLASPAGARVVVTVSARDAWVELGVRDRGPGLSEEERARAFGRFWRRGDRAGSGLGLAVARRLVEADGGTIELRPVAGGGLEALVRLPAADG